MAIEEQSIPGSGYSYQESRGDEAFIPSLGYNYIHTDGVAPTEGGELRVNSVLIPDMMVGNTRVAEAWLNGVKVFDNANY